MGFLVSMNTTEGASAQAEMILYAEPSRFYSLGGLLEYLSYEGFSVSFLGLLLSIALATLALNILKQIVGTYVFGVYNPILLALSVTVAGGRFSMLFLGIAFVAVLATGFFAKRFYLLYNAKRALLISLYIFFAIISIAALRAF
ncbi:MAG TPA: hypothetical protein PK765_01055 [bacterium]|nr:hypothetical protein [bacterium]